MGVLDGKVVLITGATSGIGRAAVRELAAMGGHLVIVGRSEALCAETVSEVVGLGGSASEIVADLSVMAEVRRVADTFLATHDRLDVLINNAGAYFATREETPDGLERTFALDHVAYHLLTNLLLERLRACAPARIVSTASDAHRGASIRWDDLQHARSWPAAGFGAYGQAKLMNLLFTAELARRLDGTGVTATCLHPGFVASGFARNNGLIGRVMMTLLRPLQRTPEKGAETLVWLATSPEVEGQSGGYYADQRRVTPSAAARDADAAERLWRVTVEITGVDATR